MTIGRNRHALSLSFMGLLLAGVLLLGSSGIYARATSDDPLAGVSMVLAVPFLVSLVRWGTGVALQQRLPRTALALVRPARPHA